jgi:hypothetical protein
MTQMNTNEKKEYSVKTRFFIFAAVMLLSIFSLSSCIGIKSGIVINNDGSGTIDLVYTVSDALDSIGKQDGNASTPPLPTSRSDFERTVSRVEGLSLESYKTETQGSNILAAVKLGFDNIDALAAFLDESGQTVSFTENGGKKELVFMFNNSPATVGTHEQALFTQALEGYMFDFSLKISGNLEAGFIGQNGNPLQNMSIGTIETQNNTVSYKVPMAELVFAREPVMLKIVF